MIITNILKGLLKKRFTADQKSVYAPLDWWTTKIMKHESFEVLKKRVIGGVTFNYYQPYEVIKTYKEIFVEGIYHFKTQNTSPVIIDAGANIGLSTLYFSKQYPNATIYAFEPDEKVEAVLQKNIHDNDCTNVIIHQEAVWRENTTLSFDKRGSEGSHISDQGNSSVLAIDFATFLSQFEQVDFLKMDIEGAEWDVVNHITSQLPKIHNFFLEYHGKNSDTHKLSALLQIVEKAGFKVYIKMAADALSQPFIEKSTASIGSPYDVQLNIFCYK
jgi:FkbM family methyltransferase